MRRPLKPFVTEYKGSNRRGASGFDVAEQDKPKSFDPIPRFEADDSYEAAMRAADALFSAPAAQPAEPANDAGPSTPPSQPVPSNGAPTGRILRVLDEPPPPEFAALEAQHAPKKRGRKPGSKNKPKPPVDLLEAAEQAAAPPKRRGRPPKNAVAAATPARTIPAIATLAALPNAVPAEAAPAKSNGISTSFAERDEKRFPWVRDRLKPGEAWKRRRLPRVCW